MPKITKTSLLLIRTKKLCELYNINIPFDNDNLNIEYIDDNHIIVYLIDNNHTITWEINYNKITKTCYKNDKFHNIDGSAIIWKENNQEGIENYINGFYINDEILIEYQNILTNKLLQKILF